MSCAQTLTLVEGDRLPTLDVTFTGQDITGYTLYLHVQYRDSVLTKTAEVVNAAAGECRFTWDADDLMAGKWPAEIETIDPDGKALTFQGLVLNIIKDIG